MNVSEKSFNEALSNEYGMMQFIMNKGDDWNAELNPNRENLETIYHFGLKNPDKLAQSFNNVKKFQKEFIEHLSPVLMAISKDLDNNPYTKGLPAKGIMKSKDFE